MAGGSTSTSERDAPASREATHAQAPASAARRRANLVGPGVALLGLLILLGFLVFVGGAGWNAATVGLALAAGALLFALRAFFQMAKVLARPNVGLEFDHETFLVAEGRRELQEERRRLLRAINELKFDYEMGKLSDADYREVRQGYELKAIEVMRVLEADGVLDPELVAELRERGVAVPEILDDAPAVPVPVPEAGDAPAQAEGAAIVDAVSRETAEVGPGREREEDAPIALDGRAPTEPPTTLPICGSCRSLNDTDAKFCKHCGAKLK